MTDNLEDITSKTTHEAALLKTASLMQTFFKDLQFSEQELARSNAATITYLDRLIVLAGGVLTLIFTVLGNLSGQLQTHHLTAAHPGYVKIACWLLVTSIGSGLLANVSTLKMQGAESAERRVQVAEQNLHLSLVNLHPGIDLKQLPKLKDILIPKTPVNLLRRRAMWFSFLAQITLMSAFVCLALFVQTNASALLTYTK